MVPPTFFSLSSWAESIAPSPTLAVDSKAKALAAAGHDVCGFGAGEPDFGTPEFITEAGIRALREGKTKYGPAAGIQALREAVAGKYGRDNGLAGVKAEQVVISPGGKYSCMLAVQAVCGPGDEVIIPAPYWVSYPEMVKLAGGKPVTVFAGRDQGYKVTPEQIREAVSPRTKLLILNSPSNPTGAVYTRKELEAITATALELGLYILSDEMYEHLLYDGAVHHSPASFSAEAAQRVMTVWGFSKTFAMTGWRLGTLVAAPRLAKACGDIQSQTTSGPTTFAQYGALAAMQDWPRAMAAVAAMLEHFDRRRKFLLAGLNAIAGVVCPRAEGAFYLFPDVSALGLNAETFALKILEEEKVAVVPGEGFGAPGYLRLSYATGDEVLAKGLERMARFCARLRA